MISQVHLPDKVIAFFIIVAVVSVAVLVIIGFSVRKASKRMGLANSIADCLGIFVPILLVIFLIGGLLIFDQNQPLPVEQYQPNDIPQYEQEMQQEMEMQSMNLRED
ncbi:hypothetical protein Poly51_34660 [Rubripirellula tenax]|uniref:Uncharacterized protein n=1 Tax=Rubripirellula tenax TaxID=2528015 RepID=A0A5C6F2W9_9BACT|nr:hypothetical protein [Rubripirellula tenax]TWU54747.1 hypothetical protein Poly51_34660 [Rubripirellula tenax]